MNELQEARELVRRLYEEIGDPRYELGTDLDDEVRAKLAEWFPSDEPHGDDS